MTTAWDAELVAAAQTTIDAAGDGRLHTVAAAVRDTAGGVHTGINLFHFTGVRVRSWSRWPPRPRPAAVR